LETDGSNVAEVMSSFRNEPERFSKIGRRNARESLLQHDWAYRWRQILEIAGLKPAPALEKRERKLKELAGLTDCED
jgi:hypothetical protein